MEFPAKSKIDQAITAIDENCIFIGCFQLLIGTKPWMEMLYTGHQAFYVVGRKPQAATIPAKHFAINN